jgi:hypothetical protein
MDQLIPKDVVAALKLIEREVMRARAKEHRILSPHDGYAHLIEGLDGLWVSAKATPRVWTHLRSDAVQIAATAVRFILDITDVDDERFIQAQRDAGLL